MFCELTQCWQKKPCCLHPGQEFSIAEGALSWLQDIAASGRKSLLDVMSDVVSWGQQQPDSVVFGEVRCLWCDISREKVKVDPKLPPHHISWLGSMQQKYQIPTLEKAFRCVLDYGITVRPFQGVPKPAASPSRLSAPVEVIGTAQDLCDALALSREIMEVQMFQVWNEQRQELSSSYKISEASFSEPLLVLTFQSVENDKRTWSFSIEDPEVCTLKILSRQQRMVAITISSALSIEETSPARAVTFDRGAKSPHPAERMMFDKPAMYIAGLY